MGSFCLVKHRDSMIKIALLVCSAALAAAEADADALYGAYGYGGYLGHRTYSHGLGAIGYSGLGHTGYSTLGYSRGYGGYGRGYFGKRSADAEPEAEADALYGAYGYGGYGGLGHRTYSHGLGAIGYGGLGHTGYSTLGYSRGYGYGRGFGYHG